MARAEADGAKRREIVTPRDIEKEFHRLHESKILLVTKAEQLGLEIPRSCCVHGGESACVSCSANWLVAQVRMASARVN
jgi:hypothetical protein